MNAIIFGATGMVGIEVLHECLANPGIQRVTAVGRGPTGATHDKLIEIEHSDFTDYSPIRERLREADICLYCLGVYQGMVSTDEFWEITCTYLEALVRTLEELRHQLAFCLFSAQGADPTERSRFLFAKAKGRAERILFESKLENSYAFRPGYISPGRKKARSRVPSWMAEPFFKLIPAIGIGAPDLAGVMLHVALEGSDERVFENADLRKLAAAIRPGA